MRQRALSNYSQCLQKSQGGDCMRHLLSDFDLERNEVMEILGKAKVIERIRKAVVHIQNKV